MEVGIQQNLKANTDMLFADCHNKLGGCPATYNLHRQCIGAYGYWLDDPAHTQCSLSNQSAAKIFHRTRTAIDVRPLGGLAHFVVFTAAHQPSSKSICSKSSGPAGCLNVALNLGKYDHGQLKVSKSVPSKPFAEQQVAV